MTQAQAFETVMRAIWAAKTPESAKLYFSNANAMAATMDGRPYTLDSKGSCLTWKFSDGSRAETSEYGDTIFRTWGEKGYGLRYSLVSAKSALGNGTGTNRHFNAEHLVKWLQVKLNAGHVVVITDLNED